MSDLLSAIDTLTKPIRRKVIQDAEGDTTTKTVTVILPSLLEQLDDAIRSSMGGSTPGAKMASEGSVLNVAALFEAMKINAELGGWCRQVGIRPSPDTGGDLRAWHARMLTNTQEGWEDRYTRRLAGWAGLIRGLLDPPREKDLPSDCPECQAKSWWKDGAEYYRPLVIRYRSEDPVGSAFAICRACDTSWAARELAFTLESLESG